MAVQLLSSLHGELVRELSLWSGCHSTGLQQAVRRCKHRLDAPTRKRLLNLEVALAVCRHITEPGCLDLAASVRRQLGEGAVPQVQSNGEISIGKLGYEFEKLKASFDKLQAELAFQSGDPTRGSAFGAGSVASGGGGSGQAAGVAAASGFVGNKEEVTLGQSEPTVEPTRAASAARGKGRAACLVVGGSVWGAAAAFPEVDCVGIHIGETIERHDSSLGSASPAACADLTLPEDDDEASWNLLGIPADKREWCRQVFARMAAKRASA